MTSAGKLPCKVVICVVGSGNREGKENEKLTQTINNVLNLLNITMLRVYPL